MLRHIISYLVVVFVLFLPLAACVYYSTRTMTKNELYLERAKEIRAHAHKFRQIGAGRGSDVRGCTASGRPARFIFPPPPPPRPAPNIAGSESSDMVDCPHTHGIRNRNLRMQALRHSATANKQTAQAIPIEFAKLAQS